MRSNDVNPVIEHGGSSNCWFLSSKNNNPRFGRRWNYFFSKSNDLENVLRMLKWKFNRLKYKCAPLLGIAKKVNTCRWAENSFSTCVIRTRAYLHYTHGFCGYKEKDYYPLYFYSSNFKGPRNNSRLQLSQVPASTTYDE